MVYKLLVDYREKKVIDLLNKNSFNEQINYESCNLEIGDFILKNENDEIIFIIERKTLNDLNCSIKDGRYKEQSMRLDCCNLENHNIIYLIEDGEVADQGNYLDLSSRNKIFRKMAKKL